MENQPLEQASVETVSPGSPDIAPAAPAPEVKGPTDRSVSRREAIEQAVKTASDKRAGVPPAEPKGQPSAAPAPSQPATNAAGRQIDPATGKFVSAAPEVAKRAYPKSWKPELEADYHKLPAHILDQIEKREADIFKGIEEYKKQAMPADVRAVLAPYEQAFQQQYGGVAQGLTRLFELSNYAASKPEEFIRWFAQSKGINLGQQQADSNAQADPVVTALQAELAGLKQELSGFKQQSQQAALAPYLNEIERFKSEAGREKFEELRGHIHALVQSGAATTLADAYDQAYRAKFPDEWFSAQMSQRQKAEQERAQQAKANAVQVKGAPSQASPRPVDPKNRRAVIENAIRNAG